MDLGIISLVALLIAIIISCVSNRNVGIICMAFAFVVAMASRGELPVSRLTEFFPLKLFIVLFAATLFFGMASLNGTVEKMAKLAVKASRGVLGLIPLIFFMISVVLAAVGPGNIATTVVLAPIAMALCAETHISPFLMTLMIVNGANAGALSPLAPTGIIANGLVEQIGVEYIGNQIFFNSLIGNGSAAIFGYLAFGGLKLWGKGVDLENQAKLKMIASQPLEPWTKKQMITLIAILTWIVLVLVFSWDVGYTAILMSVILSFLNVGDEIEAMKQQPWFTMFMLVGVMVLVDVAGETGGLEYATTAIAEVSTKKTISPIFGFTNGFVSIFSGSSAVVMPTFIPLIPGLAARLGVVGADAVEFSKQLIYSSCVSSHLVDASPFSLLGALCIASAPAWENKDKLFRKLIIWGASMSVFAAIISFLFWNCT